VSDKAIWVRPAAFKCPISPGCRTSPTMSALSNPTVLGTDDHGSFVNLACRFSAVVTFYQIELRRNPFRVLTNCFSENSRIRCK
jgi:hypothetical protein